MGEGREKLTATEGVRGRLNDRVLGAPIWVCVATDPSSLSSEAGERQ